MAFPHKYLYAEDNPVNNTDPSGNQIDGEIELAEYFSGLDSCHVALPKEGSTLNLQAMSLIAQDAQNNVGSMAWSSDATYGKYGSNVDKCNIFVAAMVKQAGASIPNTSGSTFLTQIFPLNPPSPDQLADKKFSILYWQVISNPIPGAIESSGAHCGIVSPSGTSSISVFRGGIGDRYE